MANRTLAIFLSLKYTLLMAKTSVLSMHAYKFHSNTAQAGFYSAGRKQASQNNSMENSILLLSSPACSSAVKKHSLKIHH